MGRKITEEEFENVVLAAWEKSKIRVLTKFSEFRGTNKKLLCFCEVCNTEITKYYGELRRTGCKKCKDLKTGQRSKIQESEYNQKCKDILIRKNMRVLTSFESFHGGHSVVEVQCTICDKTQTKNWTKLVSKTNRERCKCQYQIKQRKDSKVWYLAKQKYILLNMNINILTSAEDYTGQKQKLQCECLVCFDKFEKNINMLLTGYGCKKCSIEKAKTKQRMSEVAFNAIKEKFFSEKNAEILIEYVDYRGSCVKFECLCHTCGGKFKTSITYIGQGQGCSICNKTRLKLNPPKKLKIEQIKKDIEKIEKNLNLRLLLAPEELKTVDDHVDWECIKCGRSGRTKYYQLKQNKGCKKCGIDKRTKNMIMSKEKFAQNVSKIEKFSNCKLLSTYEDYSSVNSLLNWRCDICGLVWASTFAKRMYRKTKCPNCCYDETEQEKLVGKYIECLGVQFTKHSRSALRPDKKQYKTLELDIWCNNQNFGVELNGTYWHSSTKKKNYKDYHKTKYNLAKEAGIDLIQIFEDEYISNPDLIHSIIRYKVGKPLRTISASEYMLASADTVAATAFVAANSFDTFNPDHKAFALCLQDTCEPIAMFTWYKVDNTIHFQYYVARDTVVIGGLAGLLNTLGVVCPSVSFETLSDARYSLHDKELEACGFTWSHITEPDRFYCVDNYKTRIPAVGENVDSLPEIYGVGYNVFRYMPPC